jgi:hypothetical protein
MSHMSKNQSSMKKDYRINVRVTSNIYDELNMFAKESGKNISEVVVMSLEQFTRQNKFSKDRPIDLFKRYKLIGSFDGPEDLSSNYKKYLTKSLDRKHRL